MPLAHPLFGYYEAGDSQDSPRNVPNVPLAELASSGIPSGDVVQDAPMSLSRSKGTSSQMQPGRRSPTETRQELIERIKREQRAARWHEVKADLPGVSGDKQVHETIEDGGRPPILIEFSKTSQDTPQAMNDTISREQVALGIERPRSALHSGDFREDAARGTSNLQAGSPRPHPDLREQNWLSSSPTTPWYTARYAPPRLPRQAIYAGLGTAAFPSTRSVRPRAVSQSLQPPSFVFVPPTSPLVNEDRNSDNDMPDFNFRKRSRSPEKASRRRTFSPGYLQPVRSPSSEGKPATGSERALPNIRREGSFPYQAHQPRRSLSSFSELTPLSVQTPSARTRRPSQASDVSPLQRAPMVGRYEESILRGRMSSLPSRPLDFVARIGVLGRGNCKPSLKCPPHIAVPFPAVFYNYGSRPGSPTATAGEPSPYVGMIDLEAPRGQEHIGGPEISIPSEAPTVHVGLEVPASPAYDGPESKKAHLAAQHRRDVLKTTPRGGYRIPQQGQLQIIIKNPNKTAVKLFLVPYDLTGMGVGQKTFIRQRSYSAGPVIDMPLSVRKNLGTDRPEAALTNSDDPNDRPRLRYLIHLNVCFSSKGRFYLYKSIRVVFANRVPDGKEKLRQEIQLPEPRFSRYRAEAESVTVKADPHAHYARTQGSSYEVMPTLTKPAEPPVLFDPSSSMSRTPRVRGHHRTLSFPLSPLPTSLSRPVSRPDLGDSDTDIHDPDSPCSTRSSNSVAIRTEPEAHLPTIASPVLRPNSRHAFRRLARDDFSKDSSFRDRTRSPKPGEGLLALQFRDRADRSK